LAAETKLANRVMSPSRQEQSPSKAVSDLNLREIQHLKQQLDLKDKELATSTKRIDDIKAQNASLKEKMQEFRL
jgi:hypothetical protein